MIRRTELLFAIVAMLLSSPTLLTGQNVAAEGSRTVEVEMVDFAFRPATVTARPGDTIRFVQTTTSPHNVEFRDVPDDATLGEEYVVPVEEIGTRAAVYPPPRMGPFLVQEGETYEFVVTGAFAPGEYGYVCTPHEPMGMTGKLIVEKPTEVADASGG